MGFSGPTTGSLNTGLGSAYTNAMNLYGNLGNIGPIAGADTETARKLDAEMRNYMGQAGALSSQLKNMYGQGATLAEKQLESSMGKNIQTQGQNAVQQIRENPYASGVRGQTKGLSDYLAPMEQGLYSQNAQNAQNQQQLGLGAIGQQMNIPSMYNAMMGPQQFLANNQLQTQQFNANLAMQNIANQLARAGGFGNLSQLFMQSQNPYMMPNAGSQFGQSALGGLMSMIGPMLSAFMMGA